MEKMASCYYLAIRNGGWDRGDEEVWGGEATGYFMWPSDMEDGPVGSEGGVFFGVEELPGYFFLAIRNGDWASGG